MPDILRVDPESERQQVERLKAFKADRDQALVERRLEEIRDRARGTDNLLPVLRQALKDRCSLGEVCGAMRDVFGEYQPSLLSARCRAGAIGAALGAAYAARPRQLGGAVIPDIEPKSSRDTSVRARKLIIVRALVASCKARPRKGVLPRQSKSRP